MSAPACQSTTGAVRPDGPDRILVLLKPDAVERRLTGEVLRRIEAKGYEIVALRMLRASTEMLAEHYREHADKPFYPSIVTYMTRGPIIAAVVEGERVVEGVRSLMGATEPTCAAPGTIRGDLGRAWPEAAMENLVHGSDCPESAQREIAIWFPELASSGQTTA